MEPSKEAIAVRIARLNRMILNKVSIGSSKSNKRTLDREALLDALTFLYDECNDDPVKKSDELVRVFVDKYRSTLAELRRTRVCISDFDMLQTIGRGYFGEVHMVREKETCDVYAMKILKKEQARKRAAGAPEDERDVLATAAGPWVPRLQYAFQDNSNLYLVMELCNGGDIAGLLTRRSTPLNEKDAAFYIAEVAHALKALHALGYVHRDVKPHNILLDRCGHVKLGDFGSCSRLSEGACSTVPVGTADYVAPELLAAAECASRHAVCSQYCRGIVGSAISACDYWSLGVVAFELVTLRRPFSTGDDDTLAHVLANIHKYEHDPESKLPFDPPPPRGPSEQWASLVAGLLRVAPARRYNYLDTLQHPALQHLSLHNIRDQAPPWVPCVRGAEDTSYFSPPPRAPAQPSAAPFRSRPPFAGQLPFIGYSYVAPEEPEDSISGFSSSHDCTAINLATFKSAEKLAAMRAREIASLQSKLAAAEAAVGTEAERTRRAADAEAERQRARLQAEITALSLQNRRLERQVEVEKEERMTLERSNQDLRSGAAERTNAQLRVASAQAAEAEAERTAMRNEVRRLEERVAELQAECGRALGEADAARAQQKHYKNIIEHAQQLRHRRLTEINVRAIDTIAKERALRRQTLSGGDTDFREATVRATAAEANAAKEARAREQIQMKLATVEAENATLQNELRETRREMDKIQKSLNEQQRVAATSSEQVMEAHKLLADERSRVESLLAQIQTLEQKLSDTESREKALEDQYARTEARFNEQLNAAEERATTALSEEARHCQKVTQLEQLVRQLERQVGALEGRACTECEARAGDHAHGDTHSDTESVGDATSGQVTLLKEQLERAEAQLQAKSEEIALLRQEARTANLARWRKEREYSELSVEAKSTARDLKRVEERLSIALEGRKTAEQKVNTLQREIDTLKPQYERASKEADRFKEQLKRLEKTHETAQAEVDRSRNDIRKLKSELQYSEKRRLHAEEQEELSSRERAQLRDELAETRAQSNDLVQNNKALQEACSLLEEQLTDLEKLADIHELKNKELESETQRLRAELSSCRSRLADAERESAERGAAAGLATQQHEEAREQARHARTQMQLLKERVERGEGRIIELEAQMSNLEGEYAAAQSSLSSAAKRLRDLQEECAELRTRAHQHREHALQLQAALQDAQEEASASREAAEAATAWWRTRETKADATLRQQAKLIDFLQAKVEEAGRKKCSLSNKLFGRTGRRSAVSPPLRRVNRELREEVERLRAKLASTDGDVFPPTPKRDRSKQNSVFKSPKSIDTPDGGSENSGLQIVWSDGSRDRVRARVQDGALVWSRGGREVTARLHNTGACDLPQNEAARAFTVKVENTEKGSHAAVVCANEVERATWMAKLSPADVTLQYCPATLTSCAVAPDAAVHLAPDAVVIGCPDGLRSLRSQIQLEWSIDCSPPRHTEHITSMVSTGPRALLLCGGVLAHCSILALTSAARRLSSLKPTLAMDTISLLDGAPHMIKAISSACNDTTGGHCAVVACGRRVFVLRFDAARSEFKIARSITVDRPPNSLLLTANTLYIAGEKPLRINLPSGALEAFALEEPMIAAAAKKHSPPKAILLIRYKPLEILLCYAELGVFVDVNGKRTRNEDPKWSAAVRAWEFVYPFLYVIGDDRVTICHISDEAYKSPPCTCDSTSLTSTASEFYMPETFNYKVNEPALIGTAPNGIIIRFKTDDSYSISIVEGMAAFRSIGASVESLDSVSDTRGSSTDLAQSLPDLSPQDISQENIEPTTDFLADIRNRAKQLRMKNRREIVKSPDDVIKEILTTEVGCKRMSKGRKSPATVSEFDSDTESEHAADFKCTADVCGEMFTRQVRFQ